MIGSIASRQTISKEADWSKWPSSTNLARWGPPSTASTAIGVVHHSRSGMASGINNTFRQIGIATGIAGLGAIFQHDVTHKTIAALADSTPGHKVLAAAGARLGPALVSGDVGRLARSLGPATRGALAHAYRVGFTGALTNILLVASAVAISGAALAFALVRSRDFVTAGQPAGAPEPAPAEAGAGPPVRA